MFDWRALRLVALDALSRPPPFEHIERHKRRGELVRAFVLPLELCRPFNRVSRTGSASTRWALGKLKSECYEFMRLQNGGRGFPLPLAGRPQVICIRFSSSEPDMESGWCKNPVDRLRVGKNGLGIIVDDRPRCIELRTWWEPAKPKAGFVYLEVRS